MQLTPLGLVMLLCSVPLFAASAYVPVAATYGLGWMAIVVLVAIADARHSRANSCFELTRVTENKLSLGAENPVRLVVRSRCHRDLRLTIRDTPPEEFHTSARRLTLLVPAYSEAEVSYVTCPPKRGDFQFGDLYVRGSSRLGLATWQVRVPATTPVRVYPNVQDVARYELLARSHRLEEAGYHVPRERGKGTEFESLREYVPDDAYRAVDWKATARRGKPIVREYETERSQNVMLVLDLGRMMTAEIGGMSKLDYAVNAALMLAHVACSRDDAVGLIAFGREVEVHLPARKGAAQIRRLLEQLYSLQPTLQEPDYATGFRLLHERSRKRALVVIFTDLVDADASARLLAHVAALHPRHLPLLVAIRDPDIEAAVRQIPRQIEDAYQAAVAANFLTARERALSHLRARGALVLDVLPSRLTVSAVNAYLRLKRTARL